MQKLFFLGILFLAAPTRAMVHVTSEDSENSHQREHIRAQRQAQNQLAFFKAAASGNTAACRDLLALGVHLEAVDVYGRTALHHASYYGFVETIYCLLEAGASLSAIDARGNTPLHLLLVDVSDLKAALRKAIIKLAVYMVRSRGADIRTTNLHGATPLDVRGIRDFESSDILHRLRSKRYRH